MIRFDPEIIYTMKDLDDMLRPIWTARTFLDRFKPRKLGLRAWLGADLNEAIRHGPRIERVKYASTGQARGPVRRRKFRSLAKTECRKEHSDDNTKPGKV
jgi:hypothetical protein